MSFEGHYEYRCGCGAINAADVYDTQPTTCETCGGSFSHRRLIDQTNDPSVTGHWLRIDGQTPTRL